MTRKQIKPQPKTLKRDPKNIRIHNQRNKDAIRSSLIESGPFRSIAVDRDGIVRAGNGVFEQATELGYKIRMVDAAPGELIAVRRPDLFGRAAERAAIADNRTTDLSEWDTEALSALALADKKMLEGLFSDDEIADYAALAEQDLNPLGPSEPRMDMAEAYQQKWGTTVEQLWEMPSMSVHGQSHFLYIGDCRAMPGLSTVGTHIGCFTSPPYAEQRAAKYGGIAPDRYKEWWEAVQTTVGAFLGPDGVFFLNLKAHAEGGQRVTYVMETVLAMKQEWGWKYIDEFAWVKPGYPGDMGKRFKNGFEPIYQFAKTLDYKFRLENVIEYRQSNFGGYVENLEHIQGEHGTDNSHELSSVRPSNVLHIMPDQTTNDESGGHPARFPPALPEFFISAYSDQGDRWFDPFAGSGTVAIVCERLGRLSTSVELLPKYGATILERYSQYSGATPILISPGPGKKIVIPKRERAARKGRAV